MLDGLSPVVSRFTRFFGYDTASRSASVRMFKAAFTSLS